MGADHSDTALDPDAPEVVVSKQFVFQTRGLSKRFPDGTQVIKDISLSFYPGAKDISIKVMPGTIHGIIGENGAGKSTLLKIMAGRDDEFEGTTWRDPSATVGFLAQEPELDPDKNVRENIELPMVLEGTAKEERRETVGRLVDAVGLGRFATHKPTELSGGQRQRVAVGRAIVRDPEVFLMDEPLSNLDAKLRVEARSFISKLHQRLETTFIYVTHDQVEAMTMGTRICVLNAGRLQQIDTPFNLYHNPYNVFVAGFIGSPSMNFFDASLSAGENDTIVVDTGVFQITVPANKAEPFRSHVGQQVILGIRPEDIHDVEYQPPGITPAEIEAGVDVIEQMGNEMILYLQEQGKTFIARTDPRTDARVGGRITVTMNLDNMHIFDVETEVSLAYEYKQEEMETV